jgi:hypothetical protein
MYLLICDATIDELLLFDLSDQWVGARLGSSMLWHAPTSSDDPLIISFLWFAC